MIEVQITKEILDLAKEKAKEMGKLKDSIQDGEGNIYGFLGEILIANLLDAKIENTYNYDLIKHEHKIDVKSKKCSSIPKLDYECSIWAKNIHQKCNSYAFARILNNLQTGWLLGWMGKEEYLKKARFCKMGDLDVKSNLGWKFKRDCYNLEIKELNKFSKDK